MHRIKNILGILAIAAFIIGAITFAVKTPASTVVPTGNQTGVQATQQTGTTTAAKTTKKTTTTTTTGPTSYTLADVAAHNSQASCWTTINGNVYDLTTWIGQHPGGEGAILSICGIDGTSAFTGQHGDDGRANATLATFKIGTLKN